MDIATLEPLLPHQDSWRECDNFQMREGPSPGHEFTVGVHNKCGFIINLLLSLPVRELMRQHQQQVF